MAVIFLALLYNSPAGLVLYWTTNNFFSLGKNILQKQKYAKKGICSALFFGAAALDIFLLFMHPGDLPNRLLAALLVSSVFFLPLFTKSIKVFQKSDFLKKIVYPSPLPSYLYILSCFILFLLYGGVIPASLIASSVEEFSYIGSRTAPFPFIIQTLEQAAGIFLFWGFGLYFIFSKQVRRALIFIITAAAGIGILNVFLIAENFGFLTITMTFSEPKPFSLIPKTYLVNAVEVCIAAAVLIFLVLRDKTKIIVSAQIITLITLFTFGAVNVKKIRDDFIVVKRLYESKNNDKKNIESQYIFSKTGKNILLIMLDCAIGGYVPFIFEEKPELYSKMRGFKGYPNCVSFANHTLIGALPIYGGYEYAPFRINKRDTVPLVVKQQEAYLLLPTILANAGYSVTVTDPPFDNHEMSNLTIFEDYPEIDAKNLNGKYTAQWLREHPEITGFNITELLDTTLIRFSFFKGAPLFLRLFIYDKGKWLTLNSGGGDKLTDVIINDYAFLDTIDRITAVIDSGDTYTALYAHLPHDTAFLQAPDYTPVQNVTDRGKSPLADDARFHVMTASFLLLGRWFDYLKAQGVYDNTRIILVSDHGRGSANFPGNIDLPNGDTLQSYNALLMVKDFNGTDSFISSDAFMTNADVPLIALEGVINNPVNPFTKETLQTDKDNGVAIATVGALSTYRHTKYIYNLKDYQWLHVKDNIFDPANWSGSKK